ncbi:hypothetical protein O181_050927 [Austropuccinia psidii MF-1]|uniref:Uncharacterized protein n=1 Tax=Austropuccinia psidii MF-1 TaxID=1389203 RepID=A0A9Q3HP18_9BASI|nr:hypothetical protein [Austropuccinia psidii MF-1]
MLDKAGNHANRFFQEPFKYSKERWDKSHKPPDFKVGDLVCVSTLNFKKIKGSKNLKDSFAGPFMIRVLHVTTSVQLELTGELMNSDKVLFPLKKPPLEIPPLEEGEENKTV